MYCIYYIYMRESSGISFVFVVPNVARVERSEDFVINDGKVVVSHENCRRSAFAVVSVRHVGVTVHVVVAIA